MAVNDPLHGGQPDPGSFVVFLAMQALEHPKELIGISLVEAHSVVPHKNCG
jgi:hypothetical protein